MGESLEAPVVMGGQRVAIKLDMQRAGRSLDAAEIVAHAGTLHLGTWPLGADRDWQTVVVEEFAWPAEAGLHLALQTAGSSRPEAEVILDRARFFWK